jgi:hypothetical protein
MGRKNEWDKKIVKRTKTSCRLLSSKQVSRHTILRGSEAPAALLASSEARRNFVGIHVIYLQDKSHIPN